MINFNCKSATIGMAFMAMVLLSACVTNKKYIYLQDKGGAKSSDTLSMTKVINDEYKLKPGDILYIRLVTEDEKMNEYFNPLSGRNGGGNMQMMMTQAGGGTPFYIMGYSLDKNANLELPHVGIIPLYDKSVDEAREIIRKEVSKYFKNFYLQVILAEFRFSILGSVYKPGQYFFNLNHLNVFQAISMAGDLTDIGKRTGITLMREEHGKMQFINLDLTDRNIINSPYFYIKPNDIIYVQPVKSRSIGRISNFQESLGAVLPIFSTFLLVLNTYIILQNIK
jgi:polysaccharide export outer membrane protein